MANLSRVRPSSLDDRRLGDLLRIVPHGRGACTRELHRHGLRTAVLEDGLERLDQITGSSPNWPAGNRVYVYGASFFGHLSDTYGEERLGAFADAVARQWIPYRLNAGATDAFGTSFSDAWEGWRMNLGAGVRAFAHSLADAAPITSGERLTTGGRNALFPVVSPDGSQLAFARGDGRTDLQIRVSEPDGTSDYKLLRLNNLSDFAWLPDGSLVVSELDFADPYRLRTDLVHIVPGGSERQITRGARVDHPSPSPDGRTLLAVQSASGTNRLVRVDLETGEILGLTPFQPDVYWSFPAWSPDGRWIAASRWSPGAYYDVVVMDPEGRVVQRITNDRSVDQAPTWSPDGRWLLWSSDRSGIPNIYATEIDPASAAPGPLRQVTNTLGGMAYPSVGPNGRWIYFSSYHKIGWIIERVPFDPDMWFDPLPVTPGLVSSGEGQDAPDDLLVDAEVGPYRAFATLWPHYWEPTYTSRSRRPSNVVGPINREVLGPALGVRTGGSDLVGRHRYGVDARFRTSGQTDAAVAYTYAGLGNPSLGLSASQVHDVDGPFLVQSTFAVPSTLYVAERERRIRASGSLVRRRVRSSTSLSLSVAHIWQEREFLDPNLDPSVTSILRPKRRLGEARVGASFSTARAFPYSTSAEAGVRTALQARVRRELSLPDRLRGSSSSDRSLKEVTGVVQAYQSFSGPGFSDHVLAARASVGVAGGAGADRFHFSVGGAQGRSESLTGAELFGGSPLLFPVRGYFEGRRTGRYAWSVSGEYRFPLINVHRGIGLLPVHMDRVSGSVFFDAGDAWGDAGPVGGSLPNPRGTALASVGAELQTSITALFSTRMFFRLGVARRLNSATGGAIYLRLGTAF
jgi:Tol biopolymer transport system component